MTADSTSIGGKGKGSQQKKRALGAAEQKLPELTPETLRSVFHLPIKEAATKVGYGLTRFKEVCRKLGVGNWPSRQIQALQKQLDKIQVVPPRKAPSTFLKKNCTMRRWLRFMQLLEKCLIRLYGSPAEANANVSPDSFIPRLQYKSRQCRSQTNFQSEVKAQKTYKEEAGVPQRKKVRRNPLVNKMQDSVKKLLGEIKPEGSVMAASSNNSVITVVVIRVVTVAAVRAVIPLTSPLIKPVTAILSSAEEKSLTPCASRSLQWP